MNIKFLLKNKTETGFSLIEVSIAIVVFSLGVIALSSMINYVIKSNALAKEITFAASLGQVGMETLKAADFRKDWRLNNQNTANDPTIHNYPQTLNYLNLTVAGAGGTANVDNEFIFDRKGREQPPSNGDQERCLSTNIDAKSVKNPEYRLTTNIVNKDGLPDSSVGIKKIMVILSWGNPGIGANTNNYRVVFSTYRADYY